jgi:hypothetical protein
MRVERSVFVVAFRAALDARARAKTNGGFFSTGIFCLLAPFFVCRCKDDVKGG